MEICSKLQCEIKSCKLRHPRACRHYRRGNCWWGRSCSYLHEISMNDKKEMYSNIVEQNEKKTVDNDSEIERMDDNNSNTIEQNEKEIDRMDVEVERIDDTSGTIACDICKSDEAKNECGKCGKNFCSECEFKFNGESVFEFFIANKFQNYTCSTVHN